VPVGKILKNGYLPPADWAGGVGPGTSRPSSEQDIPRGPLTNFLFAKRSLPGQAGASRPLVGRDGPRLYKPEPAPKISFYSAKIRKKRKKGEEERRESGEALFTRRFGGIFSF
jgi:hypothetical protein